MPKTVVKMVEVKNNRVDFESELAKLLIEIDPNDLIAVKYNVATFTEEGYSRLGEIATGTVNVKEYSALVIYRG